MPPAADTDAKLIRFQVAVAEARHRVADLEERQRALEKGHYFASAQALRLKAMRGRNELRAAETALASYVSKKQRSTK